MSVPDVFLFLLSSIPMCSNSAFMLSHMDPTNLATLGFMDCPSHSIWKYVCLLKDECKEILHAKSWMTVGDISFCRGQFFVPGESVFSMFSIRCVISATNTKLWHYNSGVNSVQITGRFWTQGSIWTQMTSTCNLQEGDSIYFHLSSLFPDWRNS